eukprot:GCRY01006949.1.p1 GENE.GCRY01006949.1~~GCRY01006949.1.p1  ORF type:complete len:126 (-),score=21.09 GCRY01006949.1:114-491(-)
MFVVFCLSGLSLLLLSFSFSFSSPLSLSGVLAILRSCLEAGCQPRSKRHTLMICVLILINCAFFFSLEGNLIAMLTMALSRTPFLFLFSLFCFSGCIPSLLFCFGLLTFFLSFSFSLSFSFFLCV